jgi:hypothetical protein
MARKRRTTSATDANMDSMLDTLTNVVGVLVIVLVSVMLGAQEAASKIEAVVEQLDQKEVEQIKENNARSRAEIAKIKRKIEKEQRDENRDPEKELKRLEEEAKKLEQEAADDARKAEELEKKNREATQKVAAEKQRLEEQIKQLEQATKQYELERQALALKLEKMERPDAPPIKEVRLPNPRTLPTDKEGKPLTLERVIVLCREGKIFPIVDGVTRKEVEKKLDFTVKQKRLDIEADNWLVDDPKTLSTLEDNLPSDDNFNLSLELINKRVHVVMTPKKNGGETPPQAQRGEFARAMKLTNPRSIYFRYFVVSDSFEHYLEMRKFTDAAGFMAGWEPKLPDYLHKVALKYNIGEKPPPAPPPPPGSTPPPAPAADQYIERMRNSVID